MRKIRGFKLNLRLREVQRRAKKAGLDLAALGLSGDDELGAWLGPLAAAARPAVIYDTFPAESEPPEGLTSLPGLAFSLCVTTLGPDLDAFIERALAERPSAAPLFDLAAGAALEDTARFVLGLVEEEARGERCELSPLQQLSEPGPLEIVLSRLQGHKIGVALGESGLRPSRSAAFSVSWLAMRKSRAKT